MTWAEETVPTKATSKDEMAGPCAEQQGVLGGRKSLHQDPRAGQRCAFSKTTRGFGTC